MAKRIRYGQSLVVEVAVCSKEHDIVMNGRVMKRKRKQHEDISIQISHLIRQVLPPHRPATETQYRCDSAIFPQSLLPHEILLLVAEHGLKSGWSAYRQVGSLCDTERVKLVYSIGGATRRG